MVDTSDSYSAFAPGNSGGESETIIGEWIAARAGRDRLVISTKVSRDPLLEAATLALDEAELEARADL